MHACLSVSASPLESRLSVQMQNLLPLPALRFVPASPSPLLLQMLLHLGLSVVSAPRPCLLHSSLANAKPKVYVGQLADKHHGRALNNNVF